ncbi:MAG TPA: alpha/beta hydrolase [Ancylobacter sp.]
MPAMWIEDTLEMEGMALPVRVYRSGASAHPAPLVFHLHGGAFVGGDLDCGETVCRMLSDSGAVVISADYPLAPEHRFPEALNISFAALTLLHKNRAQWAARGSRLFVAGEEAGANIAAALSLMARDQQDPPIAGQILLSPMLDPCLATKSIRAAEAGPVGCKWADGWHGYLGTADKAAHPYAAPLGSCRLGDLAPALVVTAQDDPMHDESLAYAARLASCGVEVRTHVLPAPTQWPEALERRANETPAWAATLGTLFTEFLAERSAPTLRTIRA